MPMESQQDLNGFKEISFHSKHLLKYKSQTRRKKAENKAHKEASNQEDLRQSLL
jgi:hypothetical protein